MDIPNFDVEEVQEPEGEDDDHQEEQEQQDEVKRTRSGQVIKPTQRLRGSYIYDKLKSFVVVALTASFISDGWNEISPLFGFPASIVGNDTMYFQEAIQQDDKDKLVEATIKEIEYHTLRGHWRITTRQEMEANGYKHKSVMAI